MPEETQALWDRSCALGRQAKAVQEQAPGVAAALESCSGEMWAAGSFCLPGSIPRIVDVMSPRTPTPGGQTGELGWKVGHRGGKMV